VYGVPADLDLTYLHGAELIQVCLGQYQLQFHFHPKGNISVECRWELHDATGVLIDGWESETDKSPTRPRGGPDRPPYYLHRLLGRKVTGSEVCAPTSCALTFDNGDVLRLFDDSDRYESFDIDGYVV
jgi:hypothetical protein